MYDWTWVSSARRRTSVGTASSATRCRPSMVVARSSPTAPSRLASAAWYCSGCPVTWSRNCASNAPIPSLPDIRPP